MEQNDKGKEEALKIKLHNTARQYTCLPDSYMNSKEWHVYTDKPTRNGGPTQEDS